FVKPRYGLGSEGIDANSMVLNRKEAQAAIARVLTATGVDALLEEFIEGREVTVGVIGSGNRVAVMPPLEIQFGKAYDNQPLIRMHDTKSDANSPLYWDFHTVCPAPLPPEVNKRIEDIALRAYRAVGADGYGR